MSSVFYLKTRDVVNNKLQRNSFCLLSLGDFYAAELASGGGGKVFGFAVNIL